jgi:cytoskeletal protein CcmA (bactofilin family)
MIFRRKQDEMEGFRRMREALRQQADPQDHALLDDQYGAYDEEDDELTDEEDDELVGEDELEEAEIGEYQPYAGAEENAMTAAQPDDALDAAAAAPVQAAVADAFPRPHAGGPSMTTIGADTSWSGTLRSESNVYLEGRVEGTLEVRDTIYIAERATIDAKVKARSVVVSGQLNGQVDCEGRLEVTPTGRLTGEVEVGSLVVHEGAILEGKFKMKGGAAGQNPGASR